MVKKKKRKKDTFHKKGGFLEDFYLKVITNSRVLHINVQGSPMYSPSLPKVILNFYILLSVIQLKFKDSYVEGPSEAVSRRKREWIG